MFLYLCKQIVSYIAVVDISKRAKWNLWNIVFVERQIDLKKSSSSVYFLTTGDKIIGRVVWVTFHSSLTIWLGMISIINKNVFRQFPMLKISFVEIMLQWHEGTFIVFTCLNIYTDTATSKAPSPLLTHTHHTLVKFLHFSTCEIRLLNSWKEKLPKVI